MNATSRANLRALRRCGSVVRILPLALALGLAPRPASAQDLDPGTESWFLPEGDDADTQQTIKELMRAGITEYRKHNFEPARQAFEKAWRLKHHPSIAASLADVEMKLGRYREAAEHWRYYIDRSNAEHASDRADAEAQVRECRKHLGSVHVTLEPPDALLIVDEESVGRGPFEKDILLAPGEHILRAELGGRVSLSKPIVVGADQGQTVALTVPPSPLAVAVSAPAVAPPPSVPAQSRHASPSGRTVAVVVGGVLTATAIVVGVGYSLTALSSQRDLDAIDREIDRVGDPELVKQNGACTPPAGVRPAQCDLLHQKVRELDRERNIALGAYVTGGVFAAATVATYFLWPQARRGRSHSGRPTISPWSVAGARGVQLNLTF